MTDKDFVCEILNHSQNSITVIDLCKNQKIIKKSSSLPLQRTWNIFIFISSPREKNFFASLLSKNFSPNIHISQYIAPKSISVNYSQLSGCAKRIINFHHKNIERNVLPTKEQKTYEKLAEWKWICYNKVTEWRNEQPYNITV